MIRLIGIDVDGTLVGASGVVDPAIWSAAERARAAGIRLALCSGRPAFGSAREYALRLDAEGWHSFQNGASLVQLSDHASRSAKLPPEFIGLFIEQARATEHVLELYSDDDYVCESASPWARVHAELLGVPFLARPLDSLSGPVVRAQWLLSLSDAERLKAHPPKHLEMSQSTSPMMPETQFVAFTKKGVNKATSMEAIAAAYDIPLAEVMYVGDSGNDLPVMRVVGCPIAMGNATAEVRAAARRSVGHVDEAGLAQALELAIDAL